MKLILSFLSLVLYMSAAAQPKKIDRSVNNLQGPVKSTTTVYYIAEEKFGDLTKQYKQMTETDDYNKDGLLIANKQVRGSSTTKTTYKYDNSGNLTEKKEDEDGDVTLIQLQYNADGKESEVNTFNKSGQLDTKLKKKYNDKGLLTTSNLYNGNGTLRQRETFIYNQKNQVHEKKTFDAKGEETSISTFFYNTKGLITSQSDFDLQSDRKTVVYTTWEYQYNSNDQLIKKIKSIPDQKKTEETTIEYDQFGNITNEFITSDNFEKDTFTYDSRNNWTGSIRHFNRFAVKRKYIIERTIKYY